MTAEQKQILRDALLAALVVSAPLSLPLATLLATAKAAGFRLTNEELEQHLDYLVKRGFARLPVGRTLSAGVKRWESTAEAVDYCEAEGLV
ncbi:MAG: hypothetical protein ABIS50_11500 [Luteolibacter sp.]|uniref:hypothetical protein n=1 Tax=Luteolibacter sp. TaxID=1962973 RepID=UPI003264EF89